MRRRSLPFLLVALLIAPAARTVEVKVKTAKDADFSSFKTYAWGEAAVPVKERLQSTAAWLRNEIDRRLSTKGLERAAGEHPEPSLTLRLALDSKEETRDVRSREVAGSVSSYSEQGSRFTEVTFSLEMLDAAGKPVWSGKAVQEIYADDKPNELLGEMLDKLLKKYPPGK